MELSVGGSRARQPVVRRVQQRKAECGWPARRAQPLHLGHKRVRPLHKRASSGSPEARLGKGGGEQRGADHRGIARQVRLGDALHRRRHRSGGLTPADVEQRLRLRAQELAAQLVVRAGLANAWSSTSSFASQSSLDRTSASTCSASRAPSAGLQPRDVLLQQRPRAAGIPRMNELPAGGDDTTLDAVQVVWRRQPAGLLRELRRSVGCSPRPSLGGCPFELRRDRLVGRPRRDGEMTRPLLQVGHGHSQACMQVPSLHFVQPAIGGGREQRVAEAQPLVDLLEHACRHGRVQSCVASPTAAATTFATAAKAQRRGKCPAAPWRQRLQAAADQFARLRGSAGAPGRPGHPRAPAHGPARAPRTGCPRSRGGSRRWPDGAAGCSAPRAGAGRWR